MDQSLGNVLPSLDDLFIEAPYSWRWQLLMVTLCSLSIIQAPMIGISPTFFRIEADYRCADNQTVVYLNSSSAPNQKDLTKEQQCSSVCSRYDFNYSSLDYPSSIQETFGLICEKESLLKWHSSIYFFGMLVGSQLGGMISDFAGRTRLMRLSHLVTAVSGVVMAFSGSFVTHLVAWVTLSTSNTFIWMCVVPLLTEVGRRSTRHSFSLVLSCSGSFGAALCAGFAYFLTDWRFFVLGMSGCAFASFLILLLADESPRWLWTKGRYYEVFQIMKKAAKIGGTEIPEDIKKVMEGLMLNHPETGGHTWKKIFSLNCRSGQTRDKGYSSDWWNFFRLFLFARLTFRLLLMCILWTCASSLYYGLYLGADMFDQPLHVYVVIQGVGGIIGCSLGILLLRFVGRKPVAISVLSLASFCFLICIFIPKNLDNLVLLATLIGMVCMDLFFMLCYVWTSDIMPTVVRTSALGFASMIARLATMALPFISDLEKIWKNLPLLFYGSFAIIVAGCCFFLPESKGKTLPNTLEEGNKFGTKIEDKPSVEETVDASNSLQLREICGDKLETPSFC